MSRAGSRDRSLLTPLKNMPIQRKFIGIYLCFVIVLVLFSIFPMVKALDGRKIVGYRGGSLSSLGELADQVSTLSLALGKETLASASGSGRASREDTDNALAEMTRVLDSQPFKGLLETSRVTPAITEFKESVTNARAALDGLPALRKSLDTPAEPASAGEKKEDAQEGDKEGDKEGEDAKAAAASGPIELVTGMSRIQYLLANVVERAAALTNDAAAAEALRLQAEVIYTQETYVRAMAIAVVVVRGHETSGQLAFENRTTLFQAVSSYIQVAEFFRLTAPAEVEAKFTENTKAVDAMIESLRSAALRRLPESGVMEPTSADLVASANSGITTFGDLSKDLAATSTERLKAVESTAMGNFIRLSGGLLLAAFIAFLPLFWVMDLFTRQTRSVTDLLTQIGIGNFSARAEYHSLDELGAIAQSLNTMLDNTLRLIQSEQERDAIQGSIKKLLDEVSGVASGDLTIEAEVSADFTGAIADSFNFMISQLREIVSNVQDATLQVTSSASQIQTTTEQLSRGSEAQASQIVDTSAAIDEMATSIQQVAETSSQSAAVADEARANAKRGTDAVNNTIRAMERIRNQVQETAKRIKRLGESSQEIGEITQLIGDIADRTSILALNASIQAAMAGEAGQGFAVVAEEVERLADRANNATKQIATLIKTIQNDTNEAVSAMEESTREVVEGSKLATQAGDALVEIDHVSNRLAELIQSISLATKQQARGAEALAKSMNEISEVTQHTASGTKQAAVSINNLARLADELRDSVSTFKLPGSNGAAESSTIFRRFQGMGDLR